MSKVELAKDSRLEVPERPDAGMGRFLRQPFCSLSHLLGMFLSILALVVLIARSGDDWRAVVSSVVYGSSLIGLFLASSLTHGPYCSKRVEDVFDRCDYAAIYFLIAGSYTPVCLLVLSDGLGTGLLLVEWLLALGGITMTILDVGIPKLIKVAIYLVMGWLFLFAMGSIVSAVSNQALAWLFGGAVFYSIGSVFFVTGKPGLWPGYFEAHDLWHVFVLGGCACHFMFTYLSVVQYLG